VQVLPPFIYGPLVKGTKVAKGDLIALSTLLLFYANVFRFPNDLGIPKMVPPITIDVRDVAHAHVLALSAPPSSRVGRKRLGIAGPTLTWKKALEHLLKTRPELKERIQDLSEDPDVEAATVDTGRARDVLGFGDCIDWRKTVEDTADCLLEVEKGWAEAADVSN